MRLPTIGLTALSALAIASSALAAPPPRAKGIRSSSSSTSGAPASSGKSSIRQTTSASARSRAMSSKRKPASSAAAVRGSSRSSGAASSAAKTGGTNALPYTLEITDDWATAWNLTPGIDGSPESLKNVEVTAEPEGPFERFLRILIPKGSVNRSAWKAYGKPLGGVIAWVDPRIAPQQQIYVRYSVRIPQDFDYGLNGGSLPTLLSGLSNGRKNESAAFIGFDWNREGMLGVFGSFRDQKGNIHADTFQKLPADGQWHELTLRAQLSPQVEKPNGSFEAWLDGKRFTGMEHIHFSNRKEDAWDGLALYVSQGSIGATQVATRDQHVDLAGFEFSDKSFKR